ncbi:polysaccharide pyruvyl transferase family protein [Clostridium sp. AF21-20LB]
MQKFDCFSVREKTGIKLAKEEFGVSAEWVLDPVFLCDKKSWEDLLEKGKERLNKNPSIFGYILDPNDEKEKLMHLAEKILNLKSYAASDVWNEEDTLKWMWNIPTLSNLGNEELLAHIKNCEFVMTDSFHGVCFAIIF